MLFGTILAQPGFPINPGSLRTPRHSGRRTGPCRPRRRSDAASPGKAVASARAGAAPLPDKLAQELRPGPQGREEPRPRTWREIHAEPVDVPPFGPRGGGSVNGFGDLRSPCARRIRGWSACVDDAAQHMTSNDRGCATVGVASVRRTGCRWARVSAAIPRWRICVQQAYMPGSSSASDDQILRVDTRGRRRREE